MPNAKETPMPMWHYYFRCADGGDARKAIVDNSGHLRHGRDDIPGSDFIVKGFDPLGALFALASTKK